MGSLKSFLRLVAVVIALASIGVVGVDKRYGDLQREKQELIHQLEENPTDKGLKVVLKRLEGIDEKVLAVRKVLLDVNEHLSVLKGLHRKVVHRDTLEVNLKNLTKDLANLAIHKDVFEQVLGKKVYNNLKLHLIDTIKNLSQNLGKGSPVRWT